MTSVYFELKNYSTLLTQLSRNDNWRGGGGVFKFTLLLSHPSAESKNLRARDKKDERERFDDQDFFLYTVLRY